MSYKKKHCLFKNKSLNRMNLGIKNTIPFILRKKQKNNVTYCCKPGLNSENTSYIGNINNSVSHYNSWFTDSENTSSRPIF